MLDDLHVEVVEEILGSLDNDPVVRWLEAVEGVVLLNGRDDQDVLHI